MIQAINSSNYNCCGTKRKAFGNDSNAGQHDFAGVKPIKSSKTKAIAKYLGGQFVAGAVVSAIFDGICNGYRAITKNKPLIPLKEFGMRAGMTGAAFAVIGAVFTAVFAATNKNK